MTEKKIHSGVNIFTHCFCNQSNWLRNSKGELMKIHKVLRLENMNEIDDFMINTVKLNKYKKYKYSSNCAFTLFNVL